MKIEHIAIWVKDLEKMKDFYVQYFNMNSNEKYVNAKKNFSSYFLSFESGSRIELMHRPDILQSSGENFNTFGLAHIAITLGSKSKVDALTKRIRNDGHKIIGQPRITGDGYYESVFSDPEGNHIEITD